MYEDEDYSDIQRVRNLGSKDKCPFCGNPKPVRYKCCNSCMELIERGVDLVEMYND